MTIELEQLGTDSEAWALAFLRELSPGRDEGLDAEDVRRWFERAIDAGRMARARRPVETIKVEVVADLSQFEAAIEQIRGKLSGVARLVESVESYADAPRTPREFIERSGSWVRSLREEGATEETPFPYAWADHLRDPAHILAWPVRDASGALTGKWEMVGGKVGVLGVHGAPAVEVLHRIAENMGTRRDPHPESTAAMYRKVHGDRFGGVCEFCMAPLDHTGGALGFADAARAISWPEEARKHAGPWEAIPRDRSLVEIEAVTGAQMTSHEFRANLAARLGVEVTIHRDARSAAYEFRMEERTGPLWWVGFPQELNERNAHQLAANVIARRPPTMDADTFARALAQRIGMPVHLLDAVPGRTARGFAIDLPSGNGLSFRLEPYEFTDEQVERIARENAR